MNAQTKIETGVVDIRGKQYQTVALRVSKFREDHPDWSLTSDVIERGEECVVMRAMIANDQGRVLATGFAEEYRKSSQINRTSALENAETSAIGRALAALGYGGTEYATANEVQNAIHQQGADEGQSKRTVNPPAPKRPPQHSALKTRLRGFVHEMNGCGDGDELSGFLATPDAIEVIRETKDKLPHLWDGDNWPEGIERPDEFVPLADQITKRQQECAARTSEYLRA